MLILYAEHFAMASEKITLEAKVENNENPGRRQLRGEGLSCLA